MTDASDPPVDGAEPRSAPDPVADPPPGPTGEPEGDSATLPEPSNGEALPPPDERDVPAPDEGAVDVAGGAGIGGPDGGDGETAGAAAAPADADVSGDAGIPQPQPQPQPQPEPQPEPEPASGDAEAAPDGSRAESPAAEASEPGGPDVSSGVGIGGPEQAPAEAAPAAGPASTLPPPPPELAEVPSDAGRIVSGRVRELTGEDVIVDLDDGRVGVINRRNLGVDGDPSAAFSAGDPIEGAVLARSDPEHRVVLSRTWALKKRAWESVAAAAAEGALLNGKVVSVGQKGVVVDVGVRGFVPASHLELTPVRDLQAYAGQELDLRVLDVDVDRERLVLSRRSLLLKEQRRSLHDVLSSLQPGEVRRGRVASLSDYGAFVDLGGVNGLVHLSELSWQRVRHPSEVVAVGDEIDVKILDVKVKKRRVSLSVRQLSDDPLGALVPGEIRSGPVTRLVDFGAFVSLSGVEGLVHLSELAEYRVSAPEEIVAPGEEVRVKVLSVDRKRRRIELSIRQAAEYGG